MQLSGTVFRQHYEVLDLISSIKKKKNSPQPLSRRYTDNWATDSVVMVLWMSQDWVTVEGCNCNLLKPLTMRMTDMRKIDKR